MSSINDSEKSVVINLFKSGEPKRSLSCGLLDILEFRTLRLSFSIPIFEIFRTLLSFENRYSLLMFFDSFKMLKLFVVYPCIDHCLFLGFIPKPENIFDMLHDLPRTASRFSGALMTTLYRLPVAAF